MRLSLITGPSAEPVTLDEVRGWLNIDSSHIDANLARAVLAARLWCENYCSRRFVTQTWEMALDAFTSEIEIPIHPVQAVDSIVYIDSDGAEQTLTGPSTSPAGTDWQESLGSVEARIMPPWNGSWPSTRGVYDAVRIRFTVGYGGPEDVPHPICQAIAMLAGHAIENTEATAPVEIREVPFGVRSLLTPYMVPRL